MGPPVYYYGSGKHKDTLILFFNFYRGWPRKFPGTARSAQIESTKIAPAETATTAENYTKTANEALKRRR